MMKLRKKELTGADYLLLLIFFAVSMTGFVMKKYVLGVGFIVIIIIRLGLGGILRSSDKR